MEEGMDTAATGAGLTDIGEGGIDMVAPLAVGLIAVGSAMSGVYNVGKAVENRRYWTEYARNTGFAPRYPWRSGYYDYLGSTGASLRNFGFSYGYLKNINSPRSRRYRR